MMQKVNQKIKECKECPTGTIEYGWGTPGKILFIGQCPAQSSNGKMGDSSFDKFFLELIKEAGLEKEDFFFTNIIKVPVALFMIDVKMLEHCGTHVTEEIREIQPKKIITLGNLAKAWTRIAKVECSNIIHPGALKYKTITKKEWIDQLKLILK